MNIIGISGFDDHDSSVTLLRDGKIVAFCHEERLNRQKHTCHFPKKAILYCLREGGLDFHDIDRIGYFKNPWIRMLTSPLFLVKNFPRSIGAFQLNRLQNAVSIMGLKGHILREIGVKNWHGSLNLINHHLAHSASAFYLSGFQKSGIISMDFSGEYHSTWIGAGDGYRIINFIRIPFPHSIGFLYGAATTYLGWHLYSGAGKLMGLASYGDDSMVEKARRLYRLTADGFELDLRYFDVGFYRMNEVQNMVTPLFIKLFGPPRKEGEKLEQRHADLARAVQLATEDIILHLCRLLYRISGLENLCLTGGVALNSVANGRINQEKLFENVSIMPICADAGCSLGAALAIHYRSAFG